MQVPSPTTAAEHSGTQLPNLTLGGTLEEATMAETPQERPREEAPEGQDTLLVASTGAATKAQAGAWASKGGDASR